MKPSEAAGVKLEIGDQVVHPHHGVGVVVGMEEKKFQPNAARLYYVISIPDTTLWVPVDLSISGLRKLGSADEIIQCRKILLETPQELNPGRDLLTNLSNRLKQGTVLAQCEVVRDLTTFGWYKPLYGPISDFQRTSLNVLCQEWAMVQGVTLIDASCEINDLLKKGRPPQKT